MAELIVESLERSGVRSVNEPAELGHSIPPGPPRAGRQSALHPSGARPGGSDLACAAGPLQAALLFCANGSATRSPYKGAARYPGHISCRDEGWVPQGTRPFLAITGTARAILNL
jgi:hypothetical protein